MITYRPSIHFLRSLKSFDDCLYVRWVEGSEELQIWSKTCDKRPVLEHKYCRNNQSRDPKKPMFNWNMEWIVLKQLIRGRKWQHMSATEFQNDMLDKRDQTKAKGQAEADEKLNDFLSDPYWHKKRLQERDNNDLGACKTQWAGTDTNPGGQNNDENLEPK